MWVTKQGLLALGRKELGKIWSIIWRYINDRAYLVFAQPWDFLQNEQILETFHIFCFCKHLWNGFVRQSVPLSLRVLHRLHCHLNAGRNLQIEEAYRHLPSRKGQHSPHVLNGTNCIILIRGLAYFSHLQFEPCLTCLLLSFWYFCCLIVKLVSELQLGQLIVVLSLVLLSSHSLLCFTHVSHGSGTKAPTVFFLWTPALNWEGSGD